MYEKEDFIKKLGVFIGIQRNKLGYSRKDFISKLVELEGYSISERYYADIENGKSSISLYKLIPILSFLEREITDYSVFDNLKKFTITT